VRFSYFIQQFYEATGETVALNWTKSTLVLKEMQTLYLLLDKSLSHINKQCIRRIKNISAAPPRISINSVPEAEECESTDNLLCKIRHNTVSTC
jgi:hypothetical protein